MLEITLSIPDACRQFDIIYICDKPSYRAWITATDSVGLPAPCVRAPLELLGQRRIELVQAFHDRRHFIPLSKPNVSSTHLEPGSGEFRYQTRGLPVGGDRAVQPTGVAISLSKKEERRKGGSAYGARTLQGASRLPRLPCQTLGLPEQVPGPDVLRVALDDPRERCGRLRIFAAAHPGVRGDHPPIGAFGVPALSHLGMAQQSVPIPFLVELGDSLPLIEAVSAPGEGRRQQRVRRERRGFHAESGTTGWSTAAKRNTGREGRRERPEAGIRPCFDRRRPAA